MLGDFFNCIICLKKKKKFWEMKGGQAILVGTSGKHSLVRGRKSQEGSEPEGHMLLLGRGGSTGQAQAVAARCPCVATVPKCS